MTGLLRSGTRDNRESLQQKLPTPSPSLPPPFLLILPFKAYLSGSFLPCCSVAVSDFATPSAAARQASLTFTIYRSLLKLMSIESVMPSNHLILCGPLLPLPSIFPSIRVFSNEPALCIRWPKYQSFNVSPSSEYSGLISFRIDWFYLL